MLYQSVIHGLTTSKDRILLLPVSISEENLMGHMSFRSNFKMLVYVVLTTTAVKYNHIQHLVDMYHTIHTGQL